MNHPTKQLRQLKKSIQQARRIVAGVPPLACSTPLQHLKLQAFVMLSHSALEDYLEQLGREVVREARRRFNSQGRITHTLVALVTAKAIVDLNDKASKRVTEELTNNLYRPT